VFVQLLMPWMKKYRVFREARQVQALASLAACHSEKEDEKGLVQRFGEDIHGAIGTNFEAIANFTEI
jgi:hypothetical protein